MHAEHGPGRGRQGRVADGLAQRILKRAPDVEHDQAEAHQRNFMRSGESPAREYIDEGIRLVYEQLNQAAPLLAQEGWSLIDSTRLNIEETVASILERSAHGFPGY